MSKERLTPPIKVIEVNGTQGGKDWTDWLLADENVREFEAMTGSAPIYCAVGNKEIADEFVRRVNAFDDMLAAWEGFKLKEDWIVSAQGSNITLRVPVEVIQAIAAAKEKAQGK